MANYVCREKFTQEVVGGKGFKGNRRWSADWGTCRGADVEVMTKAD
jgi:hypothetical protein